MLGEGTENADDTAAFHNGKSLFVYKVEVGGREYTAAMDLWILRLIMRCY